jgi:hypothetical protein
MAGKDPEHIRAARYLHVQPLLRFQSSVAGTPAIWAGLPSDNS